VKLTADDVKWADAVKSRANWTCERCGKWHGENDRGLNAAHVFSRRIKRTRCDPENGVALCTGCHLSWAHSHPLEFHAWARKHIGARRYDALKIRASRMEGKPDLLVHTSAADGPPASDRRFN